MRPGPLLSFIITLAVAYVVFWIPGLVWGWPVPVSLLGLYLFFTAVVTILVLTTTDEGARGLVSPILRLLTEPSMKRARGALFLILPPALALMTWAVASNGDDLPVEFRSVHPSPPAAFSAYGRSYSVEDVKNPLRRRAAEDPTLYREYVAEGGEIYFRNCFFCHGAKLDGRGHYAHALDPRPLTFLGSDTIAQLEESYVFWRVVKGGRGLPKEAAPWNSAMPAWEDFLSEEEIWKVILFIYDHTGNRPRAWEGEEAAAAPVEAGYGDGGGAPGESVYMKHCSWCHGVDGDGMGPATSFLNPPPRDFTFGDYRWKSTPFDDPVPTDADLYRVIAGSSPAERAAASGGWTGLGSTSMPSWSDILAEKEVREVASYVKGLSLFEEKAGEPVDLSEKKAADEEEIENGRRLFKDRCSECHGELGRGNGRKRLKDDFGERTWPRNLTRPWTFRGGSSVDDIYTRITVGLPGTQMPSFADPDSEKVLTEEERWDVANYVATLAEPGRRPTGRGLIRAAAISGELPAAADDGAWEGAKPSDLHLFPQIMVKERLFKPTLGSITVRALYNGLEIAFLLEWDDPTESVPGVELAEELSVGELYPDAVAVELPARVRRRGAEDGAKPYFGMGGPESPVAIWYWRGGSVDEEETIRAFKGLGKLEEDPKGARDLSGSGTYDNGRWRVVIKGPSRGLSVRDGYVPVAFAAWDGSNEETGSRHVMTSWQTMGLGPRGGDGALIRALGVFVFVALLELLWITSREPGA